MQLTVSSQSSLQSLLQWRPVVSLGLEPTVKLAVPVSRVRSGCSVYISTLPLGSVSISWTRSTVHSAKMNYSVPVPTQHSWWFSDSGTDQSVYHSKVLLQFTSLLSGGSVQSLVQLNSDSMSKRQWAKGHIHSGSLHFLFISSLVDSDGSSSALSAFCVVSSCIQSQLHSMSHLFDSHSNHHTLGHSEYNVSTQSTAVVSKQCGTVHLHGQCWQSIQCQSLELKEQASLQFKVFQLEVIYAASGQAVVQPKTIEGVERISARLSLHSSISETALQWVEDQKHQRVSGSQSLQIHPVHVNQSKQCRAWTKPQVHLRVNKAVFQWQCSIQEQFHLGAWQCQAERPVHLQFGDSVTQHSAKGSDIRRCTCISDSHRLVQLSLSAAVAHMLVSKTREQDTQCQWCSQFPISAGVQSCQSEETEASAFNQWTLHAQSIEAISYTSW